MFLSTLALASASTPKALCSQYQNCADCLNPPDPSLNCGWCSPKPAIFADGKQATQCMDHTSTGWDCFHLYMHDGCIQGYTCNQTKGQCELAAPGQGDTKDNCERSCNPPSPAPSHDTYTCNVTTFTCEIDPSGQSKETCSGACSNSTPAELVGLWRGLNVQFNFTVGEWVMNYTATGVTWGPIGAPRTYKAHVATIAPQQARLSLTAPAAMAGTVRYASFSTPGWPTGPESRSVSLALQTPSTHQLPPFNVDAAMGKPDFDVFVMHGCNSWVGDECNFAPAFTAPPPPPITAAPLAAAPLSAVNDMASFIRMLTQSNVKGSGDDACSVHSECGECIADPLKVCGWCDGIITFGDGSTCGEDGKGCCGGASSFSRCNVVYRKECPVVCDWTNWTAPFCREATTPEHTDKKVQKFQDCAQVKKWKACEAPTPKPPTPPKPPPPPVLPKKYTCDAVSFTCKEDATAGHYNSSKECDKACYNNEVAGIWRGLRIDKSFVVDEWDFNFSTVMAGSTVTYKSKALGKTFTGTYAIGAAATIDTFASYHLTVTLSTGEVLSGLYSDKASGPITRFMYLGLPLASGDVATDYHDAMQTTKQELVLIACLPTVAGCDFRSAML